MTHRQPYDERPVLLRGISASRLHIDDTNKFKQTHINQDRSSASPFVSKYFKPISQNVTINRGRFNKDSTAFPSDLDEKKTLIDNPGFNGERAFADQPISPIIDSSNDKKKIKKRRSRSAPERQKYFDDFRSRDFVPIKITLRIKPHSEKSGQISFDNEKGKLILVYSTQQYKFRFEEVQCDTGDVSDLNQYQQNIFDKTGRPFIDTLINGYNCCLLAYGPTGSGKTYSVMGNAQFPGIVPRFLSELLSALEEDLDIFSWNLELSYYEIYNERIYDLLATDDNITQLKVREHPQTGPFIDGLVSKSIKSLIDLQKSLIAGNNRRTTCATSKNENSSRSHAICMLSLTQQRITNAIDADETYNRESRICFVDLAGSERASLLNDLRETTSINKSIYFLGKVILQLAKKSQHISYRDSMLTWILKDYLGGNSHTHLLVTVNPDQAMIEETLNTLRYASQAKAIVCKAFVNDDILHLLKTYQAENKRLKERLDMYESDASSNNKESAIEFLERDRILAEKDSKISQLKDQVAALTDSLKNLEAMMASQVMLASNRTSQPDLVQTVPTMESNLFRSTLLDGVNALLEKYGPKEFEEHRSFRRTSCFLISHLINDANTFLSNWCKHFKFSYEEVLNESNTFTMSVKLTNLKMNIYAMLSIPVFKERFEALRSAYESGSITAESVEHILLNRKDKWCSALPPESNLSSLAIINSRKEADCSKSN